MSDVVDKALKNAKNANDTFEDKHVKPNIQSETETNDQRLEAEDYKRKEDRDDAKHSEINTRKLNKIYSCLLNVFCYCPLLFFFWLLLIVILYLVGNMDIDNSAKAFPEYQERIKQWLPFIKDLAKQSFYAISFILFLLLTFPTAKGIRRLFREIIVYVAKK